MSTVIDASLVSKLVFPRPIWRYLLLFQSWAQMQSWGFYVTILLALMSSIFAFLKPRFLPVEGVLIGTVLGSLVSLIMVLPAEFVVRSRSSRVFSSLTRQLEGLGYVLQDSRMDAVVYRQKLPRYLRWDEGNVTIKLSGDRYVVKGAMSIVIKVRHSLISNK